MACRSLASSIARLVRGQPDQALVALHGSGAGQSGPVDQLLPIAHELGLVAKKKSPRLLDSDEALFLRLCEAILNLDYQKDADEKR